jgi:hypothetical protein
MGTKKNGNLSGEVRGEYILVYDKDIETATHLEISSIS